LPDDPADPFLTDFIEFQRQISFYSYWNALSQTLLKLTCPGVPDVYQGTELWDFSLVDPDNRRPVDYACRRALLAELKRRIQQEKNLLPLVRELMANPADGRLKLFTIFQTLNFRRGNEAVVAHGNYQPCPAAGDRADCLCAFTRTLEDQEVLVAVPRLVVRLTGGSPVPPLGADVWQQTYLQLPKEDGDRTFRNLLTGQGVVVVEHNGTPAVAAGDLFAHFPVFLGLRIK
jgi:(1->4)-alpha-D-glucan 1-alpha-D-glucosylmutase